MSSRAAIIALAVFASAFFSFNIGAYDLWAPDEPRFAQVAREMLDSGNWFTPHVNGEPYMEKPPVFFWAIAAVSSPFGDVSALTARVPSVLAAAVTIVLTYTLALRLFNDRVAWWSAVILMTTTRFWWQARTAQIDMVLTALLMMSLYAFWRHIESPSRRWRVVFFGAIAVALLAKGPVGILFPLLLWIVYHWRRPDRRKQFPIAVGAGVSIVVALLWLIPARMAVATGDAGGAIGQDFYRQVIGRAVLGVSKAQPPWYYFIELPIDLMPWTLIVPWAIVWAWRNRTTDQFRLLIGWTVPAFILFSIMAGKRQIYLLPLFPAFAILIAVSVMPLLDDARARYRSIASAVWAVGLIGIACLPLVVANQYPGWSTPSLYCYTGVAIPSALITLFELWRNNARRLPALLAIPIAALMATTAYTALPKLNEAKSARTFCAPLQELTDQDVDYRLYSFMFSREEYIFYSSHFHETVFVDSLPGLENIDLADVGAMLAGIEEGFLEAVASVPVESPAALTDDELIAIQVALAAFRQALIETNPEGAESYVIVETAAQKFATEFVTGDPAFMFIQTRDWPWLRTLAPKLAAASIVSEDDVGSRHVLLAANASATLPARN